MSALRKESKWLMCVIEGSSEAAVEWGDAPVRPQFRVFLERDDATE